MAEAGGERPGVVGVDVLGRRKYTVEFKRRLARMALEPGASVAGIALAHRINANQLFKWRRWYLRLSGLTAAKAEPKPETTLLPVVVAPVGRPFLEPAASAPAITERDAEPPAEPGQIEIALGRARVRVKGAVDPALLDTILTHLRRR